MAGITLEIDLPAPAERPFAAWSSRAFTIALIGLMVLACFMAGWMPVGFSIVTVFLFAGPHNWLEARYMLRRMPARWGPLTGYFSLGIAGVVSLTLSMAALRWLADWLAHSDSAWLALYSIWNTALIAWIATLALMRSQQNPRRDWRFVVPAAFMLIAVNWLAPLSLGLSLVYLHPLLALWFLDRELGRTRSAWQTPYRYSLLLIPLCLAVLWWRLSAALDLPGNDWLSQQIAQHAGAGIIQGCSTHFLVSAHTFLEMLHYGVWIAAIPLVSIQMVPWRLDNVPLARRSPVWRHALLAAVATGAVVMLALWGGFMANYPLTRDIYFTVAMLHVLAEVPFLLRLL